MAAPRQIPLFDLGPDPVSAQMRKDLAKLERRRPDGLYRWGRHWRNDTDRIGHDDAVPLLAYRLARVDYTPPTPRQKITQEGRRVAAELGERP